MPVKIRAPWGEGSFKVECNNEPHDTDTGQ